MPTITIEPDLYQRVETAALMQKASVDEVMAEAARYYLWDLERQKISDESRTYLQMHSELKNRYLGQYVAMSDGAVIDHDPDMQALHKRIRQRYGRTPVMITLVDEEPIRTLTRTGFRFEKTNQ